MARWIFVRHGESVANAEGWLAGHRDTPLTVLGERQAQTMRPVIEQAAPARAFASDLVRARRTAEILLETVTIPLQLTPALRERSLGQWEGRDKAGLRQAGDLQIALTLHGRPPEGESLDDVACRALAFLHAVDDGTGPTLIVAHGGLIRVVLGLLDRLPERAIGTWNIRNTEVLVRDTDVGTWGNLR